MSTLRHFGFLLKDVSRLYSLNFERHSVGLKLTLPQCRVLCNLQRNEGISQVRLATLTDTDPMTLVRLLDRMEADGLIERRPDPLDRRARRLFLRDAAAPVLDEIWRLSDRSLSESMSGLSAADRSQLVTLLQRMHANLDTLIPNTADHGSTMVRPETSANAPATRATKGARAKPPAKFTVRAHAATARS